MSFQLSVFDGTDKFHKKQDKGENHTNSVKMDKPFDDTAEISLNVPQMSSGVVQF